MSATRTVGSWLWKLAVCAVVLAVGAMLGGATATALGLEMPRMPAGADETVQFLLLFPGQLALAAGLAAMAVGLAGRWWERWVVLAAFAYVILGVGNTLEGSIFSNLGGEPALLVMHLPAHLLGALAVALLFPLRTEETLQHRIGVFFSGWTAGKLATRLGLAWLAFPVIYFFFGMIIAPIVTPHYDRLDFLVIPPVSTILTVLAVRSAMLLLVSLPVIAGWCEPRGRLILALGLGHFTAVGLSGLIQAPFFPAVLLWTHGVEILADSFCYAWVLAWLLVPRPRREAGQAQPLQARHA